MNEKAITEFIRRQQEEEIEVLVRDVRKYSGK